MQLQHQVPKLLPLDHMDTCEAMPGISAVSDMERSETSAFSAFRMLLVSSGKVTGPISRGKAREASKLKIPPAVVFESIVLFEKISSILL